jgi:hypothetical protein
VKDHPPVCRKFQYPSILCEASQPQPFSMQTHTVYPDGTTSATSTCGASVVCLVLVEKIRAAGESTPKVYSRTRSCVQTCPHERSFMLLPRLTRERLASGVNGAPNCSFSLCPSHYRMEESTAHPTFSGISQLYCASVKQTCVRQYEQCILFFTYHCGVFFTYDHRILRASSPARPVKSRGAVLRSINWCSSSVTLFSHRDSVVAAPTTTAPNNH